jgi:exodeoxyribonuclease VII large subunit
MARSPGQPARPDEALEGQLSFFALHLEAGSERLDSPPPGRDDSQPPPDLRDQGDPSGDGTATAPVPQARTALRTPPAAPRIFAVTELVRAARLSLETRFGDVRAEGEIAGLRRSGPGHLYFCLKEGDCQIDCVLFSREAGRLRFPIADGQLVRCRGRLTIYEGRGKFQFSLVSIEPAGAGLLALAFEDLKRKLQAEGLFAPERKRPLPFLPRRIGVVTSPGGAVIRDIVRVAHRRFPVPVLLSPTPVQGEGAARSIIAALRAVAAVPDVDVVILARGGGSAEDLWCFNDQGLARAIAACRVPVISAVGHETDFTIADFVADRRAPTPSAAAEIAVPVAADLQIELQVLGRRLARATQGEIRGSRLLLERLRGRLPPGRRLVEERRQLLDELSARASNALSANLRRRRDLLRGFEARLLRAHPQRRIADQRAALVRLERRLGGAASARIGSRRRALEALTGKLQTLSPLSVLERGYSLARRPDGTLCTSAAAVRPGERLEVLLRDGEVGTRVERVQIAPSRKP